MADRILMTPEELNQGAATLRGCYTEIEAQVRAINDKITEVCSNWEGAAQQSFFEQYESQMRPILTETLPEVIEGIAKELEAAADAVTQTDETLASAFKGNS